MKLALMIEVQERLSWPRWAALTSAAEQWGFSGVFLSDHFGEGTHDTIETITGLTYLASHSTTLHFGSLVSPLSMRDPVMLTRQALAINNLSHGRMILGIGAGWQEDEHTKFGYNLGDVNTRMERLEEGAHIIHELVHKDTPVTFDGRYFRIQQGLLPRSQHLMPIMIGGNGAKRTLPIVAKYADIWNFMAAAATVFKDRSTTLDKLLQAEGRKPTDVKRTVFVPICCWRNEEEKEKMADFIKRWPWVAGKNTDEVFDLLRTETGAITGLPDSVIDQLRVYQDAGANELMMMPIIGAESSDYIEKLGKHVLPSFSV